MYDPQMIQMYASGLQLLFVFSAVFFAYRFMKTLIVLWRAVGVENTRQVQKSLFNVASFESGDVKLGQFETLIIRNINSLPYQFGWMVGSLAMVIYMG